MKRSNAMFESHKIEVLLHDLMGPRRDGVEHERSDGGVLEICRLTKRG